MSTKMQGGSGNGFVIDEDGKYHLVPLKLPELMSVPLSTKKSSEKKCVKRKYIPIKPEKFNFSPFESNNSPAVSTTKKRKLDKTSVCKELFAVPQRKSIRPSLSKQQQKNTKSKLARKSAVSKKSGLPLIKINEELYHNEESFTLKPLKSPLVNMINQPRTPLVGNADAVELQSEQTFIMNEIRAWIQEEKEEFEIYQNRHHEKLRKLEELLNQFENNMAAPLTTTSTKKNRTVMLRKIVLNNHVKENIEYQSQSPRTKKAFEMYNDFRYNCTVLCTPKFERTSVDLPQNSVRKSLSRKIQKQCLMLQDTPIQ